MRFPSFERSEQNPFSNDADSTDELLNVPDKKETEKKKEPEEEQKKDDQKEKKKTKENKEKEAKKPEKPKKSEEETVEVKKNKRKRLVERSLQYKRFYEEVPIPRNPWVIARLMVADHLLALHTRLKQPNAETTPTEEHELLASFDYMGIIADKLEDPELETSPEIEETCEIIVHLAEETLQENELAIVENIVAANAVSAKLPITETLPEKSETTPLHSTPTSGISPAGTALITVLLHTRQPVPSDTSSPQTTPNKQPASPQHITEGGSLAPDSTKEHVVKPAVSHPRDALTPPLPRLETPTKIERATPENKTFAPTPVRTTEALAGLAVATVLLNKSETVPSSLVRERQAAPPAVTHYEKNVSSTSQAVRHSPAPHHFEAPSYVQPLVSRESKPHTPAPRAEVHAPTHSSRPEHIPQQNTATLSSHEIEHLPLQSLLKVAETVSIGHGQRLRSAYEKGMIDKEGLVKVLKSHTKHHDFLHEYKQQVVRRRNTIQSSPEFLSRSSANTAGTHTNVDKPKDQDVHQNSEAPMAAPKPSPIPSWPIFPNPVKNTPDTDPFNLHEQPHVRSAWFGIAGLGLLILGIALLVGMYLIFS